MSVALASHLGVVPPETRAVLWQSTLIRRRNGADTTYVISIIRNELGDLIVVGAWAREGAAMQYVRHMCCHGSIGCAATGARALLRRKESQGYQAIAWTPLDDMIG